MSAAARHVEQSSEIVGARRHPPGLDPIICYADLSCLYADGSSATGYTACDEAGNCRGVAACAEGSAFSEAENACVTVGDRCGVAEATHEVYSYDASGACATSGACETDWVWNGERCGYAFEGDRCDVADGVVWRYDGGAACTRTDECDAGVFSTEADGCVVPNTMGCAPPVNHRLFAYDAAGACVAANECEPGWEFVEDSCQWARRSRLCDPTPEELALDDKRVFEYDVMGSCLPTNRCAENWDFDGRGCVYSGAGTECSRQNRRIYRYDERQTCAPQECEPGWTLSGQQCVFDRKGEECKRENNQIFRWTGSGECSGTGACVSDAYFFNSETRECATPPALARGCPSGFAPDGEGCYRRFGLGGEGTRSVSFRADPSYEVRARYDFRKDPRWNDGNYAVSSNFGLGGRQGGVRGSHSRSSGWTRSPGECSFTARQNDGSGTLHVWLRPG